MNSTAGLSISPCRESSTERKQRTRRKRKTIVPPGVFQCLINLDEVTITDFREQSAQTDIPCRTLINLRLSDRARPRRKPNVSRA